MRTTVDIEPEVLTSLKERAAREGTSLGQVISALARQSSSQTQSPAVRNGVRLFTPQPAAEKTTLEVVNRLRDSE